MADNGRKNNLIMQSGILVAAGIISRIIGLLYRSPLQRVVGNLGMGYYNAAYDYYTIILLISSYSIPSAISKVIAQKLAVKEYRNAHRLFYCALLYVLVVGGIASLFLFFGAGLFVGKEAVPVLRTFAPTIFIYGILGVLRGYFQAHRSMAQTSVSQILEQIANAAVSVGAAYLLIRAVMGTMEVPEAETDQILRATNGAIGSALGTGIGVAVALIFMLGMYGLNRSLILKRVARDRHPKVDSYGEMIKTITFVVTPFILSTAIYNLSNAVNNKLYTHWYSNLKELSATEIYSRWGIFTNQALTMSNVPMAVATAMASAMIPSVAQMVAAKNVKGARDKIGLAVKATMIVSIPCAAGLMVLARPIIGLLFSNETVEAENLAVRLLMALALSVIFNGLSTLTSSILQGLGKVNTPIINAAIALAVQTSLVMGLLYETKLDLYSIVIANTAYSFIMYVLNQWAVRRAVNYRQEISKSFLIPCLAAVFMGAAAWAVYEGLFLLTGYLSIALISAILLGAAVYFAMLILMKGVSESELRGFPKGYLLVKAAKKCRLMR